MKAEILKFRITEPVLSMELEELSLSQRALNCLHRCDCKNVEDILDKQKKLYTTKGCGATTIKEVKNKIFELQLAEITKAM